MSPISTRKSETSSNVLKNVLKQSTLSKIKCSVYFEIGTGLKIELKKFMFEISLFIFKNESSYFFLLQLFPLICLHKGRFVCILSFLNMFLRPFLSCFWFFFLFLENKVPIRFLTCNIYIKYWSFNLKSPAIVLTGFEFIFCEWFFLFLSAFQLFSDFDSHSMDINEY